VVGTEPMVALAGLTSLLQAGSLSRINCRGHSKKRASMITTSTLFLERKDRTPAILSIAVPVAPAVGDPFPTALRNNIQNHDDVWVRSFRDASSALPQLLRHPPWTTHLRQRPSSHHCMATSTRSNKPEKQVIP
jgi:hypothetical protein